MSDPGAGRLGGKVVVVTGAAQGQGAAEARRFVAEGAEVVLADVRDDLGGPLAAELGERARYATLDVADERSWATVVDAVVADLGGIDVLVNNAGIIRFQRIDRIDPDEFRRVLDVNLVGAFLGIRAVTPTMQARGGGSIVNISSTGGLVGMPSLASYSASKFGVTGLTRVAAIDLGPLGIRVNAVHPGSIDTPMIRGGDGPDALPDEAFAPFAARLPLGRLGTPADVAGLVAFLASDDSGYCTGASFVVDGGQIAGDLGLLGS